MAKVIDCKTSNVIMAKLDYKCDLLEELTKIAIENNIALGKVEAIGAVSKATIGYYDQDTLKYHFKELNKHLEILALAGNISLKDGIPMIHAHITLADEKFNSFGGHLAAGTTIFACEAVITAYSSEYRLERGLDKNTRLPLWD